MTDSGYPRTVYEWRRGTPLSEATKVYEGEKTDVAVVRRLVVQWLADAVLGGVGGHSGRACRGRAVRATESSDPRPESASRWAGALRGVVRGFRALSLAPRRGVWWSRRRARRRNALAPAQRFWVAMEAGRPRASGRLPARCLASVRSMPLAAHVDTTCTPSRKTRPTLSNRPRPSPSACNASNQRDGSGGTTAPARSRPRPRNAPTKPP